MSIVVSDTSPILNLARIGRLDLLPALYGEVMIPPAVKRELHQLGGLNIESLKWLVVRAPQDGNRVAALRATLDPGEAEAIALALEQPLDILLIDETLGRRIALELGLGLTGLLGLLCDAKDDGFIDRVKPILDDLIARANFWVRRDLYEGVLSDMGEL